MFDYVEYQVEENDTGDSLTEKMTALGYEVWMTTKMVENGSLKSITFRRPTGYKEAPVENEEVSNE